MPRSRSCFFIFRVVIADTPGAGATACGSRRSRTGRCIAVLATGENRRSCIRDRTTMSKPQKVKNRCVSTPSPRAALAMIRPG